MPAKAVRLGRPRGAGYPALISTWAARLKPPSTNSAVRPAHAHRQGSGHFVSPNRSSISRSVAGGRAEGGLGVEGRAGAGLFATASAGLVAAAAGLSLRAAGE